jgi:hypothetical protein
MAVEAAHPLVGCCRSSHVVTAGTFAYALEAHASFGWSVLASSILQNPSFRLYSQDADWKVSSSCLGFSTLALKSVSNTVDNF